MQRRVARRHGVCGAVICAVAALLSGCSGGGNGEVDPRRPQVGPYSTLPTAQDVYIDQASPTVNFNSPQTTQPTCNMMLLVRSQSNAGGGAARALLKYDLSNLADATQGNITITSADLHIQNLSSTGLATDDDVTFYAHACRTTWNVGNVTWNTQPAFSGASMGSVVVKGTQFDCYLPLDPTTVQAWLDSPSTNFGLVLVGYGGNGVDSCKVLPAEEYRDDGVSLDVYYESNE